jgi:hypothetical protein
MATTLRNGLVLTKTPEGLEISGRTYDAREYLKSKGGKWNPQTKAWLFHADTDFSELALPPPPKPSARELQARADYFISDAYLHRASRRNRECCSQCRRELDDFNPQGPMWYVCPTHGKWKSSYDGT